MLYTTFILQNQHVSRDVDLQYLYFCENGPLGFVNNIKTNIKHREKKRVAKNMGTSLFR